MTEVFTSNDGEGTMQAKTAQDDAAKAEVAKHAAVKVQARKKVDEASASENPGTKVASAHRASYYGNESPTPGAFSEPVGSFKTQKAKNEIVENAFQVPSRITIASFLSGGGVVNELKRSGPRLFFDDGQGMVFH